MKKTKKLSWLLYLLIVCIIGGCKKDKTTASTTEKSCGKCVCLGTETNCNAKYKGEILTAFSLKDLSVATTSLSLSNNNIKELPAGIFDHLVNLKVLDLSFNELTQLDKNIFSKLTKLEEIMLNMNQLTSLPKEIFLNCPNLSALSLNGNKFHCNGLPDGLFQNNTSLVLIDLAMNPLITLPAQILDEVPNLDLLTAYNCDIEILPAGALDNLTQLTNFEITENNVQTVPADFFKNNSKLKMVGMGMNKIVNVPADLFAHLSNLQTLIIANNAGVNCATFKLPNSTVQVDLEACGAPLSTEKIFVANFSNWNQLSSVPKTITKLVIKSNPSITSIPVGVLDEFTKLEHLDLSYNAISSIAPGALDKLSNLKELDLSRNQLTALPANVLASLKNLEVLGLGFNKMSGQGLGHQPFKGLTKLSLLQLEFNPIGEFYQGIFDDLFALKDLTLFNCNLKALPNNVFKDNSELLSVDITENSLTSLPSGMFANTLKIKSISLLDNRLTPAGVAGRFAHLTQLERVTLSDNPDIKCVDVGSIYAVVEPAKCN